MLESLNRIAERLRQPPSISVEVEKIREQISENKAVNVDLEKLQPSYETLKQRGENMITRSEGADKDLSAKGKHFLNFFFKDYETATVLCNLKVDVCFFQSRTRQTGSDGVRVE